MRTALIALVWLVVASSAVVAGDPEIQVEDSLGRKLVLSQPATRVVSLAPHLTEVVFAAGAGDQILVMSNGGFGGIHGKLLAALAG